MFRPCQKWVESLLSHQLEGGLEHHVAEAAVDRVRVLVVDDEEAAGDEAEALLAGRVELERLRDVAEGVVRLGQREGDQPGLFSLIVLVRLLNSSPGPVVMASGRRRCGSRAPPPRRDRRRRGARGGLRLADRHRGRHRVDRPVEEPGHPRALSGTLVAGCRQVARSADTSAPATGVPAPTAGRRSATPGRCRRRRHVAETGHEVQAHAAEALLEPPARTRRASPGGRRRRWCPC
jgi:hypothetical protein